MPVVKALFTDVDGVLTDGGYYYSKDGLCMKKFNTRDAAALHRLKSAGIKFYVVTTTDDEITKKRIERMNPDYAWFGAEDKLAAVKEICVELAGCDLKDAAYIGDDTMDIPVMAAVGMAYCPADAIGVWGYANVICNRAGGEGVLAEVVDLILRHQ